MHHVLSFLGVVAKNLDVVILINYRHKLSVDFVVVEVVVQRYGHGSQKFVFFFLKVLLTEIYIYNHVEHVVSVGELGLVLDELGVTHSRGLNYSHGAVFVYLHFLNFVVIM